MPKGKKRVKSKLKKSNILTIVICLLMVVAIVYFVIHITSEVKTTFTLLTDIKVAEQQIAELEKEKGFLLQQKDKLTDENYVSSMARGKYLIIKQNEQVFTLPPLTDE